MKVSKLKKLVPDKKLRTTGHEDEKFMRIGQVVTVLIGAGLAGIVVYLMKKPGKLAGYKSLLKRLDQNHGPANKNAQNTHAAPTQMPAPAWKQAIKETVAAAQDKNLTTLAAGVAFYGTLAFFPGLIALISIYAALINQGQINAATNTLKNLLPNDLANLFTGQLTHLAANASSNLISAAIAIGIALFGASGGIQNLITALNHAYDTEETRGYFKVRAISIALVVTLIILALPATALLLLKSSALTNLGLPYAIANVLIAGRWVLLALLLMAGLAAFYRYAPNRHEPHWNVVSWGSIIATLIWLAGTALFFLYVQYLADFNRTYGIFASLIILMIWIYLSSFVVLLGAEVNNHIERQAKSVRS